MTTVLAFLLLPQFFLFLRGQGSRLQGRRDIPAHKVEVDFNLLRSVLAAFAGALMDTDFLYKLVEHGVCQRVEILILVNQGNILGDVGSLLGGLRFLDGADKRSARLKTVSYDMSDFNDRLLIGLKGTMGGSGTSFPPRPYDRRQGKCRFQG